MIKYLNDDWTWVVSAILIAILISAPFFPLIKYFYQDSYIYISLSKSIIEGKYSFYGTPTQKYRPGFPIAIALIWLISGFKLSLITSGKLVCFISRLLLIPLIYIISRRISNIRAARFSTFFAVFHVYFILYGNMIYSSILASLFTLLALVFLFEKNDFNSGIAAGVASLIRPEGLFLIPARLIWNRDLKGLFKFFLPFGTLYSIWLIRNLVTFGSFTSETYSEELNRSTHAGLNFIVTYGYVIGPIVLPGLILGVIATFKKREIQTILTLVFSHGLLHVWWWWNDERFILFSLPLLIILTGLGYEKITSAIRPPKIRQIAYGGIGLLLIIHSSLTGPPLFKEEIQRSVPYMKAVKKLKLLPEVTGIITADPALIQLETHHKPTGSWHNIHMKPLEMLFKTYHTRQVRYLIYSNKYKSDYRFKSLLSTESTSYNFILNCHKKLLPFRMTISPYTFVEEKVSTFRSNPNKLFSLRTERKLPVIVIVYSIELKRFDHDVNQFFQAIYLDDPHLCDVVGETTPMNR